MPRRERDLYRYRPDDPTAQRRDAERLRQRREEELQGIAQEWDAKLKDHLKESPSAELGQQTHHSPRRRKQGRVRKLLGMLVGAAFRRGSRRRRGGRRT